MRTIQTLINNGNSIRGVAVEFVSCGNVFHGTVSHQDKDGLIVAEGEDLFGPTKVKGPASAFEVKD